MLIHSQKISFFDRSGIRTHASEDTAALTQRLRPLGHPAYKALSLKFQLLFNPEIIFVSSAFCKRCWSSELPKLTINVIGSGSYNLRKIFSMTDVGFEPINLRILLPEPSGLDHSNMLLSNFTLKFFY